MVRYDAAMTPALRQCHAQALGAEIVDAKVALPGVQKLLLPAGRSVEGAVQALQELGRDYVEYALPNSLIEPQAIPNDPLVPATWRYANKENFWWLNAGAVCIGRRCMYRGIGALDAWDRHRGDPGFRLGIIDTGFQTEKGDFGNGVDSNFSGEAAQVYRDNTGDVVVREFRGVPELCERWDVRNRPSNVCLDKPPGSYTRDHGTAVAWFAAARGNNRIFGSGVMQEAAIVPVQTAGGGTDVMVEAIRWLARPTRGNAKVVNISQAPGRGSSPLLADVMAQWPDTLWVWAAGNDAYNTDTRSNPSTRNYLPYASLYCQDPTQDPAAAYRLTWQGVSGQRGPKPPTRFACLHRLEPGDEPTRNVLASDVPCGLRAIKDSTRPESSTVEELGRWQKPDGEIGGNRGNMICVAANNIEGQLSSFSNYGRKTVEFSAPGEDLTGPLTGPDAGKILAGRSGTSYSAPLVAGVAGLVRSRYPGLTAAQTKCVLMNAAARAPLPPQDITRLRHPAFLQPQDNVDAGLDLMGREVTQSTGRTTGAGRLKADQLLRVMGIPNARFALDEADDANLGRGDCQGASRAVVQFTVDGGGKEEKTLPPFATVAWRLRGIPPAPRGQQAVTKVEARPDWRKETGWVDVTDQVKHYPNDPAPTLLAGRLEFPRGEPTGLFGRKRSLKLKQLSLKWTIRGEPRPIGESISVWLWPEASQYFQRLRERQEKGT